MSEAVSAEYCEEHNKLMDERFARDKADLEKHDKAIAEMAKLSAEIGQLVKRHDTELEKHDKRIEKLEHKPSMWFDRIINGIVSAVVAAFVAAALKKTGII